MLFNMFVSRETHFISSLMRSVHFDKMNHLFCCWRERVKAVLIIDVISVDTLNWCDDGLQLQFVQVMNHDSAVIMNLLLLMTTTSDWDNNHTQNHSRWFTLNKQLQMIRLNISPLHSVQRFTSQMNVSTLLLWTIRFI